MSGGLWRLKYDGPTDVDKLFKDPRFRDRRIARIGKDKIMKTRPIFPTWELSFTASYLPELVNEKQVARALEVAGRTKGLADYRPRYGRFEIVTE